MAKGKSDKFAVEFHELAGQPGKGDYLAVDVYKGGDFLEHWKLTTRVLSGGLWRLLAKLA